jgi:XTP/dITP diphosphohydrolase
VRSNGGEDILRGRERLVYFATANKGKYLEVAKIASGFGIILKQLKRGKMEIQSDELEEIASFAAQKACESSRYQIAAEDSGLFVHALGGFPGPYSAYVHRTIGNDGILRLLRSADNRDAHFQATVAFCKPRARPICFTGLVKGSISRRSIGRHGFGFDPIFTPKEGDGRTFAQMDTDEKNLISHRARAFAKLFNWLTT